MNFTGISFLFAFLPLLVIAYYVPFLKKFKNIILLLGSLGLYFLLEPLMLLLLIFVILFNFLMVKLFIKTEKKAFKAVPVAVDLIILFFFKYINLIIGEAGLFADTSYAVKNILMPLGISYYLFNAISYVADSTKNKESGRLTDVALYISFFGKIVAGPIVQYNDMSKEIKERKENFDDFCIGLKRFLLGLAKKVIIADSLNPLVTVCFSAGNLSFATAWLGAVAYTLQIYFDFSGYSDMAIGIGNLFGFKFTENFNYPYTAVSVSDYWKRWHISLTKWFTKYLYIPLGGNRCSAKRHIFNMAVVWCFTGLWHGSSWNFIVWGLFFFVILVLEKYTSLKEFMEKHKGLGHIYTMLAVVISWVIFRAENIKAAAKYITAMLGIRSYGFISTQTSFLLRRYGLALIIGIIFMLPVKKYIEEKTENKKIAWLWEIGILAVGILAICVCISKSAGAIAPLYAKF